MLTPADYATGKPGTGESGKMLKLLQKDRRIDRGMKYSPVFGRYSFVDKASEGSLIKVGDEVRITKRNEQNTLFGESGSTSGGCGVSELTRFSQIGLVYRRLRCVYIMQSLREKHRQTYVNAFCYDNLNCFSMSCLSTFGSVQ